MSPFQRGLILGAGLSTLGYATAVMAAAYKIVKETS